MIQKNLLLFLMLSMVVALPATSMAAPSHWWTGGVGGDWDNFANWSQTPDTNGVNTEYYAVELGDNAVISDGNDTSWGYGRIRDGLITQTGGTHEWQNGARDPIANMAYGLSIFNKDGTEPARLHMTGGHHITDVLALGLSPTSPPLTDPRPDGVLEVWGSGVFTIRENPHAVGPADPDLDYDLFIATPDSYIDIRDSGQLRVPNHPAIVAKVDGLLNGTQLFTGEAGKSLSTFVVGSEYVVSILQPGDFDVNGNVDGTDFLLWQLDPGIGRLSDWEANFGVPGPAVAAAVVAVPEPGSAMLAMLGLGLFAGSRRRQKCCN